MVFAPKRTGTTEALVPPVGSYAPHNYAVLTYDLGKSRVGLFRRLFACGIKVSEADD